MCLTLTEVANYKLHAAYISLNSPHGRHCTVFSLVKWVITCEVQCISSLLIAILRCILCQGRYCCHSMYSVFHRSADGTPTAQPTFQEFYQRLFVSEASMLAYYTTWRFLHLSYAAMAFLNMFHSDAQGQFLISLFWILNVNCLDHVRSG